MVIGWLDILIMEFGEVVWPDFRVCWKKSEVCGYAL